jgi:hypothetical protein
MRKYVNSVKSHIHIAQYYTSHMVKFVEDLAKTDPEFDEDTSNIIDAVVQTKELKRIRQYTGL